MVLTRAKRTQINIVNCELFPENLVKDSLINIFIMKSVYLALSDWFVFKAKE